MVRPAHDGVRLDAYRAKLFNGVLRRLRLELPRRPDVRQKRDVDVERIAPTHSRTHLTYRLEERLTLDVADRTPDLDQHDVRRTLVPRAKHELLDDVRDVRHGLDRTPEVIAATLLPEQLRVHLARRDVRVVRQLDVDETLVVPQVEVRLAPVASHEHLPVLVRRHRPRVDVQVRVELLHRDRQPSALQDAPDRRRADPLTDRAHHAPRHEDVLRRHTPPTPLSLEGRGRHIVAGEGEPGCGVGCNIPLAPWERATRASAWVRVVVRRPAKQGTLRRRWLATDSGRGVVACTIAILGSAHAHCQSTRPPFLQRGALTHHAGRW